MKQEVFHQEFNKLFNWFSNDVAPGKLHLEPDLYKNWGNLFLVNDSYYFIMNHNSWSFDLVSKEVEQVLGYAPAEVNFNFLLEIMHPEDKPWFLDFGTNMISFFSKFPIEKIIKYKLRYDIRYRKKNGDYARILYQGIIIEHDNSGKILRTFVVNTDISYLKYEGKPTLSFIGLDGEPSYVDVDIKNNFIESTNPLTEREKEIIRLLIEGKLSKEIGSILNISKQTVDTHRKNMLRKNNLSNTGELIGKAIRYGWI
ncbi:MAG: LuxR C-terminal-related transcriptional regulator [Ferruginibacter sp.]